MDYSIFGVKLHIHYYNVPSPRQRSEEAALFSTGLYEKSLFAV